MNEPSMLSKRVLVVDPHGKPLAEPIIGLTSTDFYNLYLEQAIDAGRIALRP